MFRIFKKIGDVTFREQVDSDESAAVTLFTCGLREESGSFFALAHTAASKLRPDLILVSATQQYEENSLTGFCLTEKQNFPVRIKHVPQR